MELNKGSMQPEGPPPVPAGGSESITSSLPETSPEAELGTNSSSKPGITNTVDARGKFSPESAKSFKTMTPLELSDKIKEMRADFGNVRKSYNQRRRAIGQALYVMRQRIADAGGRLVIGEGELAVNWDEFCTSIGENRRSCSTWADNWHIADVAPWSLIDAAEKADIDLYQPRTANILNAINAELNGKIPSEREISALLERLDPRTEPKAETSPNKRKSGNRRNKPKPVLNAPQAADPKDVAALREICSRFLNAHPEEREREPFLSAFAEPKPSAPADEVFRPIIEVYLANHPVRKRKEITEAIATVAAALGSTKELPTSNNPISGQLDVSASPSSEMSTAPSPEKTVKPTAKPRRRLPLDFDENNDVLQDSPVFGGRKPIASEVTANEDFAVTA